MTQSKLPYKPGSRVSRVSQQFKSHSVVYIYAILLDLKTAVDHDNIRPDGTQAGQPISGSCNVNCNSQGRKSSETKTHTTGRRHFLLPSSRISLEIAIYELWRKELWNYRF